VKPIYKDVFERKDSGTWKRRPTPEGHDHFVCHGCGAQVRRPWPSRPFDDETLPGRPFDDDWKCLNCWYGKPNQEETTTHEKQPHRMTEEEMDDLARRLAWPGIKRTKEEIEKTMAMDACGMKPKSKAGEIFMINWAGWHPIATATGSTTRTATTALLGETNPTHH
jgi:hypothetical protein